MLKREVLVNGISNLSDARYCAGMFVDYLCFELNSEHADHIPLEKIIEIKNWVSGPKIGGRISKWPKDITSEQWSGLGLDYLIISHLDLVDSAKGKVSELFFELTEENSSSINLEDFDHVLCSSLQVGQDVNHQSLFVGGDVNLDNLEDFLNIGALAGIALTGNHEVRPGQSNYEDLMDVLEALEEED